MSWTKFDNDCPGCRPVLCQVSDSGKVGEPYPENSPEMIGVMRAWNATTLQDREAWHRFTCLNSRAQLDLVVVQDFTRRMQAEVEKAAAGNK